MESLSLVTVVPDTTLKIMDVMVSSRMIQKMSTFDDGPIQEWLDMLRKILKLHLKML